VSPTLEILGLSLLAGLAIPAGGLLARIEHIQPLWLERQLRHSIIAFAGGALLSAVALVLVPDGIRDLSILQAISAFGGGALTFLLIDRELARRKGPGAQLAAMLLDFVPEAMALGATFAVEPARGRLLAFLIGLQNLPEGFNAFREMTAPKRMRPGSVLRFFLLLSLLGPIAAGAGLAFLAGQGAVLGFIMVFAAGGILYLIFQDIAPAVPLENRRTPALGAVAGFLLGLVGQMLAGGP
jgi:ZIP family zinc transporter